MKYVEMSGFVGELEALVEAGLEATKVQDYLKGTLIEPSSLDTYISYRSDRYTRNLVHKTQAFELLVICWEIGQASPIHGHEGELCWARVERGKLRFSNFHEVSEEPLVVEPVGRPQEGEAGYVDGPADVHAVENLEAFGERAATLHLYSYPFHECDIYDLARGEKWKAQLAYDSIGGKSVAAT